METFPALCYRRLLANFEKRSSVPIPALRFAETFAGSFLRYHYDRSLEYPSGLTSVKRVTSHLPDPLGGTAGRRTPSIARRESEKSARADARSRGGT